MTSGMIYLPSFMKLDTGAQAILRLPLGNLKAVKLVLLMGGIYELHH
jgi:hypothetical protein